MRTSLAAILGAILAGAASAQMRPPSDAEVQRVLRAAILIDAHNDAPDHVIKGYDIGKRSAVRHTDIPRLREGGVGAVFFAAYVSERYAKEGGSAHRVLEMIDTIRHDIVERHPGDFVLALTARDIEAARKQNKIAALIGIEGGHAIEDSPRLLRDFYALGVRYMTLTHNNTNNWADSSRDAARHNGLAPLGREVVREMNRLGMIVDVSHVSDKTFWDVLETSRAPVMASHSSCRALSNVARNMTDEMIRAMAKKGGVIQINFGCEFLSQKSADASPWSNAQMAAGIRERAKRLAKTEKERAVLEKQFEQEQNRKIPRAAVADVVAHIEHAAKVAGVSGVGIGTDFDGIECAPVGLDDVSKFANLTRALIERGFSAADIHRIYGGNTLRLMRAVEAARGL
jgi:membrane dipeptidase